MRKIEPNSSLTRPFLLLLCDTCRMSIIYKLSRGSIQVKLLAHSTCSINVICYISEKVTEALSLGQRSTRIVACLSRNMDGLGTARWMRWV